MARGSETISVKGTQATDWRGDPIGPVPEPRTVEGCILWPQSTRESNDAGVVVLETMSCYVPPDQTPPTPTDTILARGSTWNVQGAVGHYIAKRGADKGYLFTLQKVS